ncbi:MAG TPA: hypothetical protein VKU00_24795 [Chthonomonadaceae bacterium]|nr:hypothetical protein [Chthonomonadaceae bacterium]
MFVSNIQRIYFPIQGVSLLASLFLLLFPRMVLAGPPGPPPVRSVYPTFGLSVVPPAGWRPAPKLTMGQVASWERGDEKSPGRATLFVEIEPASSLTLAERVAQLQRQFGGKILDGHARLDGIPAVRMMFPGSKEMPRHEALVARRDRHTYVLEMHAAMGAKTEAAWQALIHSWKWIPTEAPAGHLEFAAQPLSLFNGLLTLQTPRILRPFPTGFQTQAKLAVVDNRTDVMALDVDAQLLPNPSHLSLDPLKASLAAQLQQMLKLDSLPAWKERPGRIQLFLTDSFTPPSAPSNGQQAPPYQPRVRYGLAPVDKDHLLLMAFTITVATEAERKVYEAVVDRMLDSLALHPSHLETPAQKAHG